MRCANGPASFESTCYFGWVRSRSASKIVLPMPMFPVVKGLRAKECWFRMRRPSRTETKVGNEGPRLM